MKRRAQNSHSSGQGYFVKHVYFLGLGLVLGVISLGFYVSGPIQKESFMGAEYCATCHQAEYQSWYFSRHRHATQSLPDDKKNDRNCLSCHATGVFEENQPYLPGVQCESCHGPGQFYAALHVKKDPVLSKLLFMQNPAEKSCRDCHSQTTNLGSPHKNNQVNESWPLKNGKEKFHSNPIFNPQKNKL